MKKDADGARLMMQEHARWSLAWSVSVQPRQCLNKAVCSRRQGTLQHAPSKSRTFITRSVHAQVNAASVGKIPIATHYGNITVANVHSMLGTYDQVSPIEPGMTLFVSASQMCSSCVDDSGHMHTCL